MAQQFRYLGRTPRAFERSAAPILQLAVPLQDGTWMVFRPRDPVRGFQLREPLEGGAVHTRHGPDRDRGRPKYEAREAFDEDRPGRGRVTRTIADARALRILRADPLWEEF